jgi:lipopolysaccharide/colanic/teichoic acid biosynthesis glycosyltransferase
MLNASQLDHRYQLSPANRPAGYADPADILAAAGSGRLMSRQPDGSNLAPPFSGGWSCVDVAGIPGRRPAAECADAWRFGGSGLPRHPAMADAGLAGRGGPASGQSPAGNRGYAAQPGGVGAALANASIAASAGSSAGPAYAAGFASSREIALPPLRRLGGAGAVPSGGAMIPRGFSGVDAVLKRAFDLVAASVLLVLVLPLLIAVMAALRMDSPGPVFFVQRRVGRGGQPFACLKLRTMRVDAERQLAALLAACPQARREWAADHKLRNDPRVSRLGRLVRKLSLDELPQLVNVLAGQMSMVGPRPIVEAEIARYGAFFPDYCAVKPGLTGLWQVSGRNDVSYGERVQFDRHYARHASFLGDLAIALRTVPAVLFASGSY